MLNVRDVYKLQADYAVADGSIKDSELDFETYIAQCRNFITKNLPTSYASFDSEKKKSTMLSLASQFVDKHKVNVKNYMNKSTGMLDFDLLLTDVINAIQGESVIKEALDDETVDEIQINDKNTIFVARKGVLEPYVDSMGRHPKFDNNEEIHILINKLIDTGQGDTPLFTDGNPLLNAKTAKHQYRLNAVHNSANTQDKPPNNFPISTVVIRKFKDVKLTLEDLVEGEAIDGQMAKLLSLLGRAELKLFCVGPTGSGKTTLLNIIAGTIPEDKRLILIQNPTEISFMERDPSGRNKRNVVHWEVTPKLSLPDLISNSLRATPDVILVGEARDPEEFAQMNRATKTGHKLLGSFHADDAKDALGRYAAELSSSGGMTYSEALRLVAENVDIIISQFKFADGKRRVMEITEICGADSNGKPILNTIFEFKYSGKTEIINGKKAVLGDFKQVGVLSKRVQNIFFKSSIDYEDIAQFCDKKNIEEKSKYQIDEEEKASLITLDN